MEAPEYWGEFVGSMDPVVEICGWDGETCEAPVLATFTMTTGPGSETIRVVPEDEHYIVNWHIGDFPVVEGGTYRIRVTVAGAELGFADVTLYANMGQAKKASTGESINLVDGRTLPIKFRIEEGAVFVVGADGATISVPGGAVTLDSPPGALTADTGITVTPATEYPQDPGSVPGSVFDFGPDGTLFTNPVRLTIHYDPDLLLPGADENALVLGHLVDDAWTEVAGSTVDVAAHTVTGLISSFSTYGVLEAAAPPPPALSASLVFSSDRDGDADLYTFDGTDLLMIQDRGASGAPDWLEDQVVFHSIGSDNYDIWQIDLATGTTGVNLTLTPGIHEFGPVWSPDGTKIAFVRLMPDMQYDIWVMDADGSNQMPLTTHPANDAAPAWSPDGSRIAFHSSRDGNPEVYTMNWDGTSLTRLTNDSGMEDGSPTWSPTGHSIAFAKYQTGGEGEIWIMNADGSNPRAVTTAAGTQDYAPAWSPDGSQIAFERTSDLPSGTSDIWVVAPDGSGLAPVVVDPADDGGPAWRKVRRIILESIEVQITHTDDYFETTPRLGADAQGDYVVYTSKHIMPGGSSGYGEIMVQRLDADGMPDGPVIQVSDGTTDDVLADASGGLIAYSAFTEQNSQVGQIKVFDINTSQTAAVTEDLATIFEARIHGTAVVWIQGGTDGLQIMYYELDWQTGLPVAISGPDAMNVDIGERYVVWERGNPSPSGADAIMAFDHILGSTIPVTEDPNLDARQPSTSGSYVVWESTDLWGNMTIELADLSKHPDDPGARRTLVDNGAHVLAPSVDGDLVAFESDLAGNYDVYLARISDGRIFQVTTHPDDQWLSDVYGFQVAYVDERNATRDVYVSSFSFRPSF